MVVVGYRTRGVWRSPSPTQPTATPNNLFLDVDALSPTIGERVPTFWQDVEMDEGGGKRER